MKKSKWGLLGMALLLSGMLFAEEVIVVTETSEPAAVVETGNFETLMICIWKGLPESQMVTMTSGVKIGIFGSFGAPVYGVEGAVICGGSAEVYGFKGSLLYTTGERLDGLGLAPVNYVEECTGVQIGAVNLATAGKVQFGLLNFMDNGFLPVFPLVNFAW